MSEVLGSWFLVLGSWGLGLGSWFLVLGAWGLVLGAWFLGLGSWGLVLGAWEVNTREPPPTGSRTVDLVSVGDISV
ncbi:MAG: hypothetical protein Q8M16_13260 [Pirellulaceae bacterium]|nr:hypothetical protein [Pirellulaceae bacterium]